MLRPDHALERAVHPMNDAVCQPPPHSTPPVAPESDGDFAALVDQFYQPLYRFALGLAHDVAQASDLTQQTFYVWALRGHQLRDRQKVKGWLYTTLYREFLREVRRHTYLVDREFDGSLPEVPATGRSGAAAVDGAAAMQTLQRVPEPFRAPLLLFYVDDFSYEEIARTLDIPLGTVMSRLSRGRAELRARFHAGGGAAGAGDSRRGVPAPAPAGGCRRTEGGSKPATFVVFRPTMNPTG